jgi:hypothetical protein
MSILPDLSLLPSIIYGYYAMVAWGVTVGVILGTWASFLRHHPVCVVNLPVRTFPFFFNPPFTHFLFFVRDEDSLRHLLVIASKWRLMGG